MPGLFFTGLLHSTVAVTWKPLHTWHPYYLALAAWPCLDPLSFTSDTATYISTHTDHPWCLPPPGKVEGPTSNPHKATLQETASLLRAENTLEGLVNSHQLSRICSPGCFRVPLGKFGKAGRCIQTELSFLLVYEKCISLKKYRNLTEGIKIPGRLSVDGLKKTKPKPKQTNKQNPTWSK